MAVGDWPYQAGQAVRSPRPWEALGRAAYAAGQDPLSFFAPQLSYLKPLYYGLGLGAAKFGAGALGLPEPQSIPGMAAPSPLGLVGMPPWEEAMLGVGQSPQPTGPVAQAATSRLPVLPTPPTQPQGELTQDVTTMVPPTPGGLSGYYPNLQSFSWGKDVALDPATGRPLESSGPMLDRFSGTGMANEAAPSAGTFSMMASPDIQESALAERQAKLNEPLIALERQKALREALTKYPELGMADVAPGLAGEVYRRRYEEGRRAEAASAIAALRADLARKEAGLQQKYGVAPNDPYGYAIKDDEVRERYIAELRELGEGFRGELGIILGQGNIKLPSDRSFGTEPPMRSY